MFVLLDIFKNQQNKKHEKIINDYRTIIIHWM